MPLPPRLRIPAKVGRRKESSVCRVIQEFTMSIPSIGNTSLGFSYPAMQSSNSKRDAVAGVSQNPSVLASDTLNLRTDAQAVASLNAKGITMVTIHSRGLSSGQQPIKPSSVVDG